ncbi:MAG: hypoxanthine phosphoribosyltransferase [Bacteroidota bacterium]
MDTTMQIGDLSFRPFIEEKKLQQRVAELGQQIGKDYEGKRPIFLCILNGSFIFTADLVRSANIECEIAFMKLSSYEGTASTGHVKTIFGLQIPIENRHVIIVEDIVDTGRTMKKLLEDLNAMNPASLKITTLLLKPDALQYTDLDLDYVGFEIEDRFVVGYGLDYDGLGRNWKMIYQVV